MHDDDDESPLSARRSRIIARLLKVAPKGALPTLSLVCEIHYFPAYVDGVTFPIAT